MSVDRIPDLLSLVRHVQKTTAESFMLMRFFYAVKDAIVFFVSSRVASL
jgi:hypothetical protein